ncbi:hypothetical protein DMA11_22915 [Marinilabiliaceae bacterium JC017]|nr:hypothetical protein DMA11_22915 [Marinilabiliaceae bacterium JC017]
MVRVSEDFCFESRGLGICSRGKIFHFSGYLFNPTEKELNAADRGTRPVGWNRLPRLFFLSRGKKTAGADLQSVVYE